MELGMSSFSVSLPPGGIVSIYLVIKLWILIYDRSRNPQQQLHWKKLREHYEKK